MAIFRQKMTVWKNQVRQKLEALEARSVSVGQLLVSYSVLVGIRTFIERASQGLLSETPGSFGIFYLQNWFIFAIAMLLLWMFIAAILKRPMATLTTLFFWGSWAVVIPPIIDLIFFGHVFRSFYLINSLAGLWLNYRSLFGHLQPTVVYFGTKIVILAVSGAVAALVYLQTSRFLKSVATAIGAYSMFFLMASFPSWLAFVYYAIAQRRSIFEVSEIDVVGFIAPPVDIFSVQYYVLRNAISYKLNMVYFVVLILIMGGILIREKLLASLDSGVLKIVILRIIALWALFGTGLYTSLQHYPINSHPGVFSWFAIGCILVSFLLGDFFWNLLGQELRFKQEKFVFSAIFCASIAGPLLIDSRIMLPILLFHSLMFLHYTYFRNQQGYLWVSSVALLTPLMAGWMLASTGQTLEGFPWWESALGCWWLAILVQVRYLSFLKNGLSVGMSTFLGGQLFLGFVFSAAIVHVPFLLWWSVGFGSLAYWIVVSERLKISSWLGFTPAFWKIVALIVSFAALLGFFALSQ